ncbi:MAG: DUF4058 family protein [Roseiflexaceae bacterium]|nr:DUF4058 family protein [Roseiflexaceae bacterium]
MPSPFPGMDPYLEDPAVWPDVHQSFITYLRDEMQQYLRPQYSARIGERIYLVDSLRSVYPDVLLIQWPDAQPRESGGVAVLEAPPVDKPTKLKLIDVEYHEPYLEIYHTYSGQVVTVIKVLSPANKQPGSGRDLYIKKQREILLTAAHLIEIDLLSSGLPTVAVPGGQYYQLPYWRYLVCVNRAPLRDEADVYTVALSQRLPRIAVPLRRPDADLTVDLQPVFDRCYANGGYDDLLDYGQLPPVATTPEERFWMQAMVDGRG